MVWSSIITESSLATSLLISQIGGLHGKRRLRPELLFRTDLRATIDELAALLEVDPARPPTDLMTLGLFEVHFLQGRRKHTTATYLGGGWLRSDVSAGDQMVRLPTQLMSWFERNGLPE